MTFEEAFELVKQKNPELDPNIGFVFQLKELSKHWESYSKLTTKERTLIFDYEEFLSLKDSQQGKFLT